jgi:hypothetical protein
MDIPTPVRTEIGFAKVIDLLRQATTGHPDNGKQSALISDVIPALMQLAEVVGWLSIDAHWDQPPCPYCSSNGTADSQADGTSTHDPDCPVAAVIAAQAELIAKVSGRWVVRPDYTPCLNVTEQLKIPGWDGAPTAPLDKSPTLINSHRRWTRFVHNKLARSA